MQSVGPRGDRLDRIVHFRDGPEFLRLQNQARAETAIMIDRSFSSSSETATCVVGVRCMMVG
jgi:hypothetical protein